MKKTLWIVCFVFIATTLVAQTAAIPKGSGTETDPYQIASLGNLQWLAENSNKWHHHYVQTVDINAAETKTWNNGDGFCSMGFRKGDMGLGHYSQDRPFSGHYDGQNHVIDSLFLINGLFAYTRNAEIKNLGVTNVSVKGEHEAGALVGDAYSSTITNCYSSGHVVGRSYVGGLVGSLSETTISHCYSLCSVKGGFAVGGLVGSNHSSTVSSSHSIGTINGDRFVGGIVGYLYSGTLLDCYTISTIHGEEAVGALAAKIEDRDSISNCYYDYEESTINGQHAITFGALEHKLFNDWLNQDLSLSIDDYLQKDITGQYLINSIDDLKKVLGFGHEKGYQFVLNNDLNLASFPHFSIPYFCSRFDGQGHIIDSLLIDMPIMDYMGLFGKTNGAKILDLGVTNAMITAKEHVGILVGFNKNTSIFNSYSSGHVKGKSRVGGLIGCNDSSVVFNCHNMASVHGGLHVGGLVGQDDYFSNRKTLISNCHNTGIVKGDSFIGGLVGYSGQGSNLENSYNMATVQGGNGCGGLIGKTLAGRIWKCHNKGNITGARDIGGLIGQCSSSLISSCYNTGNIQGYEKTGGLIGSFDTIPKIINSYYDYETDSFNDAQAVTIGALEHNLFEAWQQNNLYLDPDNYLKKDCNDQYEIHTISDLKKLLAFGHSKENNFVLCNDLDLSTEPNFIIPYFRGNFDGQDHVINNVNIDKSDEEYIGFFAIIDSAKIQNTHLKNSSTHARSYLGGFGGIATHSTIFNCSYHGFVHGEKTIVGGLIGKSWYSTIKDSYSKGTVKGCGEVGGLVGFNYANSVIDNCYSESAVVGKNEVGGLIGSNYNETIVYESFSRGPVYGARCVGGLIGRSTCSIKNCYSTSRVSGKSFVGGLIGEQYNYPVLINSYYDYERATLNDLQTITPGALEHDLFLDWKQKKFQLDINDYLVQDNLGQYQIANISDLKKLLAFGNSKDYHFVLTDHIDLRSHPNLYVPCFRGKLDGQGYTINNIKIDLRHGYYLGFLGIADSATISRVGIVNADIRGSGALIGLSLTSSISNCFANGKVKGKGQHGGLVGSADHGSSIINCYSVCSTTALYRKGDLIGSGSPHISHSFWQADEANQKGCGGGISQTEAKMKDPSTFANAGWDLETIWQITPEINNGYPVLRQPQK